MKSPLALAALLLAAAPMPALAHVVGVGGTGHGHHGPKPTAQSACTLHTYCKPARVWVPQAIELVDKQVWIAPQPHQVWIPPVYETHCGYGGQTYQVQVQPGYYQTQWTAGHFQTVTQKVVAPGHYEAGCKPIRMPKVVVPHVHGPFCGCQV